MSGVALALLTAAITLSADEEPRLRINEILYDPDGPDAGREFVELHHAGSVPLPLDGFELWFVNAASPDEPTRVWTAPAARVVAPGGFYVIGAEEVQPRDETVRLALQNGPDALWLVRAGVRVDAVAWGEDAAPWGEGAAADDPSGTSIGRVPDGADTDDNARDWRALRRPTPAEPNVPASSLVPITLRLDPPWRVDAGTARVEATFVASGWAPAQAASIELDLDGRRIDGRDVEVARDDSLRLAVDVLVEPGARRIVARGSSDSLVVDAWIGPAALRLTEVQARPASGEPEWVELLCSAPDAIDPQDWTIADATGALRRIGGPVVLAGGERLVLTADAADFLAFHGDVGVPVLEPEGGWPTLNDGASDGGLADLVALSDAAGRVVDRMTYRARDVEERGRSLQRTGAVRAGEVVWIGAVGGPTPGRPHSGEDLAAPAGRLRLLPDPFSPDGDGVDDVLQVIAPPGDAPALAEVRSLDGVLVRRLEGVIGDDRSQFQWDGRDARGDPAPAGAYVIVVEIRAVHGEVGVWREIVALGRRR